MVEYLLLIPCQTRHNIILIMVKRSTLVFTRPTWVDEGDEVKCDIVWASGHAVYGASVELVGAGF